jgi:pimeloyl-ACP methyl ester carboxylesterase
MTILYETMPGGPRLAYRQDGPSGRTGRCGFFWLGGFKSDMEGSKAEAIAALARETRRAALRFDYSGHGKSSGLFVDGTISAWAAQSAHMFRIHTAEKCVVVGSSMGGWLAMRLVAILREADPAAFARIAGLVLIAPAADMTTELMWKQFPPEVRREIEERGVWHRPSLYGEPYPITAKLLEDGVNHLMLKPGLDCPCPVRVLQGDADPDVPPQHAWKVYGALRGADVTLTLIKGGDHRLSTPSHLALIRETALRLAERADGISA